MLSLFRGKKFYEITLSINNLVIQDHHLIKKHQILSLNKLNSATLYEILIDSNKIKPTCQTYLEYLFSNFKSDGKASIYYLGVWHWI